MSPFTILQGDCLSEMSLWLEDNSVDAIVTDPPYGLSFMGKHWDYDVPGADVWAECLRVLKPGGHLLSFFGSRTYHRGVVPIEDAGFEIRDQIMWVYGSGFPKSHNGDWGGTALKPSHEPIVVARKPLVGTVEANWREWGTGALNIDGCRVATDGEVIRAGMSDPGKRGQGAGEYCVSTRDKEKFNQAQRESLERANAMGRWPANLIHDGSDEVLAAFPQAPGQQAAVSSTAPSAKTSNVYGAMKREPMVENTWDGDPGRPAPRSEADKSAARFFYCAKASRADRNDGLTSSNQPAVAMHATMGDRERADWKARNGNHHPTVKPTDLMAYLCRLVTPPGGVVLDPFMGSGSTGKAAMREGFRFIGIEREAEYAAIARARILAELSKRLGVAA